MLHQQHIWKKHAKYCTPIRCYFGITSSLNVTCVEKVADHKKSWRSMTTWLHSPQFLPLTPFPQFLPYLLCCLFKFAFFYNFLIFETIQLVVLDLINAQFLFKISRLISKSFLKIFIKFWQFFFGLNFVRFWKTNNFINKSEILLWKIMAKKYLEKLIIL